MFLGDARSCRAPKPCCAGGGASAVHAEAPERSAGVARYSECGVLWSVLFCYTLIFCGAFLNMLYKKKTPFGDKSEGVVFCFFELFSWNKDLQKNNRKAQVFLPAARGAAAPHLPL